MGPTFSQTHGENLGIVIFLAFGIDSPILLSSFSVWEARLRSSEGDQVQEGQDQKFRLNSRIWKNQIPVAGER